MVNVIIVLVSGVLHLLRQPWWVGEGAGEEDGRLSSGFGVLERDRDGFGSHGNGDDDDDGNDAQRGD